MKFATGSTAPLALSQEERLCCRGIFAGLVCAILFMIAPARAAVTVTEQQITIPTYLIGPPDPNPQFYTGGQSQGAEHRIYPYPMVDNLTNEKADKSYKMVYLENEYVRIGILPEIGGKIFEAIDKTNGYNFFYRQHVIKPTLISLLGAWISGGVEWDVPHHHRATSFLPVQHKIETDPDGSKTVWVGELELRDRMRWAVGATLHPGKSYLEVSFRVINRTPLPVSMLCFSNVAVHVNDEYQIIFPPSTQFGTGHFKRLMVNWPINNGLDISWWKNNATTSVFAWNYQDDFLAGYDHAKRAGTMAVADHNVVPGKKFFSWGPNNLQYRLLTDNDGPYIELMVGAYSDNQPDYSWLQPYESRMWTQYWYPFRDIDGVKNANTDAAVNLDVKDGNATVGFYTTAAYPNATISLKLKDQVLLNEQIAIDPGKPYTRQIALPQNIDEHDLRASIAASGKELIAYSPVRLQPETMPPGISTYPDPQQIKSNDELYLTGLRIDQFRDPQREPDPYWEEALKRDPGDVRVNTAMAINLYKKARYADAEKLLRKALERATDRYTSPEDGKPFYYLGLTLKAQGKPDEAFTNFYKSTWSAAWRSPGYFELAQIASLRGNVEDAIAFADRAVQADANNIRALTLQAVLLITQDKTDRARALVAAAARIDPLDIDVIDLQYLVDRSDANLQRLQATLGAFPANALEIAAECVQASQWQAGANFLAAVADARANNGNASPLMYYYLGYFAERANSPQDAARYYRLAAQAPTDYVFPFQREMIDVLESAMKTNPSDSRAPYYLGNLLYDWQPERAVELWEKSAALGADFPVVYRNLAWVYKQRNRDPETVYAMLEKGAQYGGNAMIFSDLDQFYADKGVAPDKRLAVLQQHQAVINRDDTIGREINLLILAGKYDDAMAMMKSRLFRAWEGAPGRSMGDSWINAMLCRGQQHLAARRYAEALADFQAAEIFPDNLSEATGGAVDAHRSEIQYWTGVAFEMTGEKEKAMQAWKESAGLSNDSTTTAPARMVRGGRGGAAGGRQARGGAVASGFRVAQAGSFYQAMSLLKLGDTTRANTMFQRLIDMGTQAMGDASATGPAATQPGATQPGATPRTSLADAHYLVGLGRLGLNDRDNARQEFTEALKASPDHLAATTAIRAFLR